MKRKYYRIFLISLVSVATSLFIYNKSNNSSKTTDNVYTESKENDKDEIIETTESFVYGDIYLKQGNEKFGLTHILMRHSSDYYKDYSDKGTLFPAGTTKDEIIEAIKQVILSGETDPKGKGNSIALKKDLYLHNETAVYRLIISEDNEVITFFKID